MMRISFTAAASTGSTSSRGRRATSIRRWPLPANLDAPTATDTWEKGPRRGVVYDIGTSPLKNGLIWAGTDDGLIWRTLDGGAHWQDVTPATLQPWSKVGIIEPSHFDADTAYAAI